MAAAAVLGLVLVALLRRQEALAVARPEIQQIMVALEILHQQLHRKETKVVMLMEQAAAAVEAVLMQQQQMPQQLQEQQVAMALHRLLVEVA
jgi:hypothetical protein